MQVSDQSASGSKDSGRLAQEPSTGKMSWGTLWNVLRHAEPPNNRRGHLIVQEHLNTTRNRHQPNFPLEVSDFAHCLTPD